MDILLSVVDPELLPGPGIIFPDPKRMKEQMN